MLNVLCRGRMSDGNRKIRRERKEGGREGERERKRRERERQRETGM